MADTKISALTAVTTPAGTDEFAVNQGGVSKKATLTQINAYCEPLSAASTSNVTGYSSDTYLAGSGLTVTAGRLQAGTFYRLKVAISKTAASTATAAVVLRMGTLGTTGDAAICTFNFPTAQTAATDQGFIEILANFNSVGSGTSAVVGGTLVLWHQKTTTGFVSTSGTQFMAPILVTSSGFNSTTVTKIGVSVNGGASASWTTATVQADLLNVT